MKTLFDAYLIVDWSANNSPKLGKDSIWWCHMSWDDGTLVVNEIKNTSTRIETIAQITEILLGYKKSNKRVLLGFDFAYSYPAGFSQRLTGDSQPDWLATWQFLHSQITDSSRNKNNRYEVAAVINRELTGAAGPFWGCPDKRQSNHLSKCKPKDLGLKLFNEYRIVEQGTAAHSVWKLYYPGSVGSQVLMGLPYLYALRTDASLSEVSRVWPFETGLKLITEEDLAGVNVLHAEIFPSLVSVNSQQGEIKDKLQVCAVANQFADLDHCGDLGSMFAGGRELTVTERQIVESEEGWILGV